jgi:glucose-6-phosphate 1-dehydrogenase
MVATAQESGSERPGDPCTIVIFGASGDLTKRKLLPALLNLKGYGLLPRELAIIAIARRDLNTSQFRELVRREVSELVPNLDRRAWAELESAIYYLRGDFNQADTYQALKVKLAETAERHRTGGNVLYYLATPPDAFAEIVQQLGRAGLAQPEDGRWRRVVVEKPFGRDLDSAVELNQQLHQVLKEDQIYRIDHYLGKETVQNVMVFRFANGMFEPIWNRRYIDHVQLTVAEEIGVEGRGSYYDQAGVVRDMIQNHMFQLLSLVAMEPPSTLGGEAVRNEKVKVLEAIRPIQGEDVLTRAVRGQYGPGIVEGRRVPGYRNEPGVSPSSRTETFAALKLQVENWRWAGVPFFLRSGKYLPKRDTVIVIQFRRPPLLLFQQQGLAEIEPNRLVIDIQPHEGIRIYIKAKKPGTAIRLENVKLDFSYKDFGETVEATGYERLLYDCMVGDSTLFHRQDMVEAAWRIVTPLLDVWSSLPPRDFPNYAAGTWGPPAADELIQRDGRRWVNDE